MGGASFLHPDDQITLLIETTLPDILVRPLVYTAPCPIFLYRRGQRSPWRCCRTVPILVQSTGSSYSAGAYGEFEIISRRADDSLLLTFDGYEPYITAVRANEFLQVVLKKPSLAGSPRKNPVKCLYQGRIENAFAGLPGRIVQWQYRPGLLWHRQEIPGHGLCRSFRSGADRGTAELFQFLL